MSRDSPSPSPIARPARGLLPALGLALLAHAWLLGAWPEREPAALRSAPLLLSLREAPRPADSPAAPPKPARPAPRAPAPATAPAPAAATGPAPDDGPEEPVVRAAQELAALPPEGEGAWRYRLRQDGEEGQAWLHWRSEAGGYALQLHRRLPSRPLPGWRSEGRREAWGLAPLRFAVLRGPREVQVLDFQHEQGLIRYSARAGLQPLAPATQDRLSWWLQLPALLQAWQVQHGPPRIGQRFEIPVALIRGGLHHWQFRVMGQDQGLWHLQRGGQGPFDTRLDVWMDPARQHLPVRLHQQVGEEEGWEMELMDEHAGPEFPATV